MPRLMAYKRRTKPSREDGALMRISLVMAALAAGGVVVYYLGFRDDVARSLRAKTKDAALELFEEAETGGRPRTEFAQDRGGGAGELPKPIEIDAKRAMGYLEMICDIGPRQSGTPGMK